MAGRHHHRRDLGPRRRPRPRRQRGQRPGRARGTAREAAADQLRENAEGNSMLGRFSVQEELDPALIYLLSSASSYVTGTATVVDGGMAAW
jgi:NAD(P)-dependent dehydrogenase (short-subunit alcohol dehydrogenase family)